MPPAPAVILRVATGCIGVFAQFSVEQRTARVEQHLRAAVDLHLNQEKLFSTHWKSALGASVFSDG
jgi:hypothetical protein